MQWRSVRLTARRPATAGHNMLAQPHDPAQQHEQPELNPDGTEKKKRRQHTRWKEEEVMRLLEGVEALGVGHWRQMCVDFRVSGFMCSEVLGAEAPGAGDWRQMCVGFRRVVSKIRIQNAGHVHSCCCNFDWQSCRSWCGECVVDERVVQRGAVVRAELIPWAGSRAGSAMVSARLAAAQCGTGFRNGLLHMPCRQRDYQLEHRTDVDLKDKWRNITKAIGQHKKMRGFNMAADLVLRVQNCMRVAAVRMPLGSLD